MEATRLFRNHTKHWHEMIESHVTDVCQLPSALDECLSLADVFLDDSQPEAKRAEAWKTLADKADCAAMSWYRLSSILNLSQDPDVASHNEQILRQVEGHYAQISVFPEKSY